MQRIALPPDSVTTVRLEDVSLADAPSQVISECVANGGQVPIPFELGVPADAFSGNERLVVSARIEAEGELLWITDTAHVVDPNNLPTDPMTITVTQVGASA
jgi:putative lipoprotein